MAQESGLILELADPGPQGPFDTDMCGIAQGDLNMIARRYRRECSQPAKKAQSKSERIVEREMGSIPAKDVRAQLTAVMGTAAKLHKLLAGLDPKSTRAIQAQLLSTGTKLHCLLAGLNPKANRALMASLGELDQGQAIKQLDGPLERLICAAREGQAQPNRSMENLLDGLMAATRDAAGGYDPTNGGTTFDAHGAGSNLAPLTTLVRLLAGLLEQQGRPVGHNEAGELFQLATQALAWADRQRPTAGLSDSIRKALARA